MLREGKQTRLSLYSGLYDIVVPPDHLLRKIKEQIDFSFVNPMLREQYCEAFGRPAKEPEMMFKLLFLKKLYDLSDVALIQNAEVNMAYKYFLDLEPDEAIADASLLTKFRKTRITEDILEEMLQETIRQAIEKGIIRSTAILVDATHIHSHVRPKSPTQILRTLTKQLRREIYQHMYEVSAHFPDKPDDEAELSEEIAYTHHLLQNIAEAVEASSQRKIQKLYEQIKDLLQDEGIREKRSIQDEDARHGHKSPTRSFFGYKAHIAMTEERLISGLVITGGNAPDGQSMRALVEQSVANGVEVNEVLGDTAYSTIANIEYCNEHDIRLIAPLNPQVVAAATPKEDGFFFNKDAGQLQCPANQLSTNAKKRLNDHGNVFVVYSFSKVKCKKCPMADRCRVGQSKTKTYSITLPNERTLARIALERTEYFKERLRHRYKIEEKNGELKCAHGLERADSTGLTTMRLQAYFTAFAVNVKRIVKLAGRKPTKEPLASLFCRFCRFLIFKDPSMARSVAYSC